MPSTLALPLLTTGLTETQLLMVGAGAGVLAGGIVALMLVIATGSGD